MIVLKTHLWNKVFRFVYSSFDSTNKNKNILTKLL